MAYSHKVTCDKCDKEITDQRFHLRLSVETGPLRRFPVPGRASVTLVGQEPPLDCDKDFCGPNCLRTWVQEKLSNVGGAS